MTKTSALTASAAPTTSGMPCGISSAARRRGAESSQELPSNPIDRRLADRTCQPHRATGAGAGAEVSPGRIRGRAGKLHDRDRDLRSAGAHAALVVRRALHLPADPAPHGAVAAVRSRVSRQSGSRVSGQEQQRRRERARHGARARSCGFLDQQHAVSPQPGTGRRTHRRTGRGACAPDRRGDPGAWARARRIGARCGAVARAAHRHRSGVAPPALSGARRRNARRRRKTSSRDASPRSARTPRGPQQRRPGRSARRFRRIRKRICSGSSRITRPSSSPGSATSSSPCARNRSISIRCSPARS